MTLADLTHARKPVRAASHRLSSRASLDVRHLADEPMLLLRRGFMTRQLFDGACHVAHVRPRTILESGSPHSLLALVQDGHGIAIIPAPVPLVRGRWTVVPLRHQEQQLGLWMSMIWDPRQHLPRAAKLFIDEAQRFTKRRYPDKDVTKGLHPLLPNGLPGSGYQATDHRARPFEGFTNACASRVTGALQGCYRGAGETARSDRSTGHRRGGRG